MRDAFAYCRLAAALARGPCLLRPPPRDELCCEEQLCVILQRKHASAGAKWGIILVWDARVGAGDAHCACAMGAAVAGDQLGRERARSRRAPAGSTHWRPAALPGSQRLLGSGR